MLVTMQVAWLQAGEGGGGKAGKWYDGNGVPAGASSGGAISPKNEWSGLSSLNLGFCAECSSPQHEPH